MRKPFQGVLNIIRFNWHFYVLSMVLVFIAVLLARYLGSSAQRILYFFCMLISGSIILSLVTSLYVYDLSGLYNLKWIDQQNTETVVININAGFDETSALLTKKFKNAELIALDFYDPKRHTEISIRRARKAYPPFPKTKQIDTSTLSMADNFADKIFVILSAHEIRNEVERLLFFKELKRVLKPTGEIYLTEHLRDVANFMAYNVGFFHFHSKDCWMEVIKGAGLEVKKTVHLNPFISTFILEKNGSTS